MDNMYISGNKDLTKEKKKNNIYKSVNKRLFN